MADGTISEANWSRTAEADEALLGVNIVGTRKPKRTAKRVTMEELLRRVDDRRMKLLNVLGALQCAKVAARYDVQREYTMELDGAIGLIEDEVQRIITDLESGSLLEEVEG